jgi:hypothetical protein
MEELWITKAQTAPAEDLQVEITRPTPTLTLTECRDFHHGIQLSGCQPIQSCGGNNRDRGRKLIAAAMAMTLTQLVGIQSSAARADQAPDGGALLSTCQRAYAGARDGRSAHRQFVTMFLPKCSMSNMPVAGGLSGPDRSGRKH